MSLPAEYFDQMYEKDPDPWGFSSRWYEARKYSLTLAALPRRRYRRAFEPGCSIGVLTAALAPRCDLLIASDTSAAALHAAAARVPGNVELRHGAVPDDWPEGDLDLVILSEIGYYLSPGDLDRLVARVTSSLDSAGTVVAVHWLPQVEGYPGNGRTVHERFAQALRPLGHYEDDFVVLDVLGGPSATLAAPE